MSDMVANHADPGAASPDLEQRVMQELHDAKTPFDRLEKSLNEVMQAQQMLQVEQQQL